MSSTVIPREKLSAYQRWELNSFDGGAATAAASAVEAARTDPRAQREGYAVGYREGMAAAKAEITRAHAAQTARLTELISGLTREVAQLDSQIADNVLDLVVIIARRMIGEALSVRPELVLDVVREALRLLGLARTPAHLVLHPDDAQLVREHLGDQCAAGGWTITEDTTVQRGGCRLDSAGGELDATLPARWQRAMAALGRPGDWLA
jgi:flagellar assembly protein FliH